MKAVSLLVSFVGLLIGESLQAYGPRSITSSGNVVKWSSTVSVDLESDLTVRGKSVSSLVSQGLSLWADLADSNVTFEQKSLGAEVDADNVCCYLFDSSICPSGPTGDGTNPIVIDDDGTIVAKFFGASNRYTTLGFAAVVSYSSSTGSAIKGEAVFNASCLSGVELDACAGLSFSEDDFVSFIVHEVGHFLGLNHAQVNLDEAEDADTSNDDKITTMYPFFIQGNGANFKTPERDDQAGLAFLYPGSGFSSSNFTVTGTVFDEDGVDEFPCANLVVRNKDASLSRSDAISFISGQLCSNGSFDGSCDGNYSIQGLDPAETYQISVEPIDSSFKNASGILPCDSAGEQPTFDDATHASDLNTSGGGTVSGVNFTLTNTSGSVGGLHLQGFGGLDIGEEEGFDALLEDKVIEIELKSAADACSTGSGGSSGGCSLIPR